MSRARSDAADNEVRRKVHFYRIQIQPQHPTQRPTAFDAFAVCRSITALTFQRGERYHFLAGGEGITCWPTLRASHPPRIAIGNLRRNNLPHVESGGECSPLTIQPDQQLVERTHMVFFGNGILGAEFNHYGPRPSRFVDFLREKLPALGQVEISPILNRDAQEKIRRLENIKAVELLVRRDYAQLVQEASPDLFAGITLSEDAPSPYIMIGFQTEPRSRGNLGRRLLNPLLQLAGDATASRHVETFKVKGTVAETGKTEWFDLLEDKFVSAVSVPKPSARHRAIDSDSMFLAIEQAYEQVKEGLESSMSLTSVG